MVENATPQGMEYTNVENVMGLNICGRREVYTLTMNCFKSKRHNKEIQKILNYLGSHIGKGICINVIFNSFY